MKQKLMKFWEQGCIVSCQALEHEPLFGSDIMAAMAVAAEQGGAVGIRANTPVDIAAIKNVSALPVIGLYKSVYDNSEVYITPTMREVREVIEAGAELVATDATFRPRPDGSTFSDIVTEIRRDFPKTLIVADVSTFEEGVAAIELGVDFVSTTLSGYTSYSPQQEQPDFELLARLAELKQAPILAEGRIWSVEDCAECIRLGAHAVVIGTAITRPQDITRRFVKVAESANIEAEATEK